MTALARPHITGSLGTPSGAPESPTANVGPWHQRLLDFLVPNLLYLYARVWHRCRRSGPNPLPARGPALVIANHPCHADAAFLMAGCRRWIHFLQAHEYYDVPGLRVFFRWFGCIPIWRDRPDAHGMRMALACLRHGGVVGVFPEADITPDAGYALQPGKPGVAWLALRSRAPVFPAFIADAPAAKGTVADWVRPAHGVRILFGQPIDLGRHYGQPITHERLQQVTDLLMQRIASLQS